MDDDVLNLNVDTCDLRRVFGMLTGYVLLPDSNHGFVQEFNELDLAGRVRTLAAGRALWHLMGTAVADSDELADIMAISRRVADEDFALLPAALGLARALDDVLDGTGGKAIGAGLVGEIAVDETRALGSLAYFLRATRIVLHATASARGVDVAELLATTGQQLAEG